MREVFVFSLLPNLLLLMLAMAFLTVGHCQSGCDAAGDFWFLGFALPFALPFIVSILAVHRCRRGRPALKLHVVILGAYGVSLILLALALSLLDPGQTGLFLFLLPLGILIGRPAVHAQIRKPPLV